MTKNLALAASINDDDAIRQAFANTASQNARYVPSGPLFGQAKCFKAFKLSIRHGLTDAEAQRVQYHGGPEIERLTFEFSRTRFIAISFTFIGPGGTFFLLLSLRGSGTRRLALCTRL